MGIELTSFELLTMAPDHPVRRLYQKEQAVRRETWQTDFCIHEQLGAVCLGHVVERQPVTQDDEVLVA